MSAAGRLLVARHALGAKVNGIARPNPLISEIFFLCVAT